MSWDAKAQDRQMSKQEHDETVVPCMRDHRAAWVVVHRKCNYSAFSGYHFTPSDYSLVRCGTCGRRWRTRAAHVDDLPDAREEQEKRS